MVKDDDKIIIELVIPDQIELPDEWKRKRFLHKVIDQLFINQRRNATVMKELHNFDTTVREFVANIALFVRSISEPLRTDLLKNCLTKEDLRFFLDKLWEINDDGRYRWCEEVNLAIRKILTDLK